MPVPQPGEVVAPPPVAALPPAVMEPAARSDGALLAVLAGLRPADVPSQAPSVEKSVGRTSLYFEANVGQTDDAVQFLARGPGYNLFLTATDAVMVLNQGSEGRAVLPAPSASEGTAPAVVRMQILGGNPSPTVVGRDELPGKINYFLGNDPAQWHTNVATYAQVEYDEVYPGIDLVYYGTQRQLEYDFVVAPGADPGQIRVRFAHADRIEIDAGGDLVLSAGGQELRQHRPFVYQDVGGARQEVASGFVLDGQQVAFRVGPYDATRPLVIDPVLSSSTYLGGGGFDQAFAVAIDPAGSAYVTGETGSVNFPTQAPYQPRPAGERDVFVAKFDPAGTGLVYATYLGGADDDAGSGIAVDAAGQAYLTGWTFSPDFPTANAAQPAPGGGGDGFITKLDAAGAALVYSTYFGGSSSDFGMALAVNDAGAVFVAGDTTSDDFPVRNAVQPVFGGGGADAVVGALDPGGAVLFATYLGGGGFDWAYGVAVDGAGQVAVTGFTSSPDFPTRNALFPDHLGGDDGFVTKLRGDGSDLVWSSYFGGTGGDGGAAVAMDADGAVYVLGASSSDDFPTVNAVQPALAGGVDAVVLRWAADGTALDFSTYLGGAGVDHGLALALAPGGDLVLTGFTASADFPLVDPVQPRFGGDTRDAWAARLTDGGGRLAWSTFLGGAGQDRGYGVAAAGAGRTCVVGQTLSADFPTARPFQPAYAGASDAFVACITEGN